MAILPVTTDLGIEEYSGGVITTAASESKNIIYNQYANGKFYATQRPSINIFEDASATVTDAQGRGIYYWNAAGARYFVNKAKVYKSNYSAPLAATLTAGTESVYFFEVGDNLVIIDPENDEGWYIALGASTTLVQITDVDFPPEQAAPLSLARGGVVLNGILYVLATDGTIWNSGSEDPTIWGAADFVSAEISPDDGVMLLKQANHAAQFGTRSTEFFYDNANPVGSPLNVRKDIDHSIGVVDFDSTWSDGKSVFYVSLNPSGDLNVLLMNNFQLSKISTSDIDSFLTSSVTTDNLKLTASGFTSNGRSFFVLTLYVVSTTISPRTTLVYDTRYKTWLLWDLEQTGIDKFPLIGWTRSTATRSGEGILSNGDVVTVADDRNPQDLTEAQVYLVDDYTENQSDYISDTGQSGDAINCEVTIGPTDFGTRNFKSGLPLRIVGSTTKSQLDVTIQTSDEGNSNYNTGRILDMNKPNQKLTRNGRFRTRNHKLSWVSTEQVEIEGLELG